jgi:ABC-2 type transport system ATP-binding protein
VSFAYRKHRLYERFTLRIDAPGVYGVFGRNGSGKSTLLKLLAGLLFPGKGAIDVLGFSPRQRRAEFLASVYVVPEEFHLPNLTSARLAQTQAGFYPAFSHAAFADYLAVFELSANQPFGDMSLGQKKKAAMAFALATFTPVLLLDEPTNGLDILGRDQFKQILSRAEQRDRVILISTHQAHDLERIMSHILFIDAAELALSATMAELSAGLTMGVAPDAAAMARIEGVIHREALGEQVAYVAANRSGNAGTVHLELLYKALSLNKDGVVTALRTPREAAHV